MNFAPAVSKTTNKSVTIIKTKLLHWFGVKAGIAIFRKKNNDENNFVECKRDSGSGSEEFF